jgi:hypothetical protein
MQAPQSMMAPSADSIVQQVISASSLEGKYAAMVDRESAYEKLQSRIQAAPTPDQAPAPAPAGGPAPAGRGPRKVDESMVEKVVTSSAFRSMLRSAGTVLGREITRSIFDTARRRR